MLKDYPRSLMPGMRDHDIVFGAELDDSLFSLDPPAGYALEIIAPPEITENDMIEWLGIAAKMNHNTFPDRYKPMDSTSYRVVYGDLSVTDVAAADLPLKVEP